MASSSSYHLLLRRPPTGTDDDYDALLLVGVVSFFVGVLLVQTAALSSPSWPLVPPFDGRRLPLSACLCLTAAAVTAVVVTLACRQRSICGGGCLGGRLAVFFCAVLDLDLTLAALAEEEGPARDVYAWFVCIPLLLLHSRGPRSCLAAVVLVAVQTTLLRYLKFHLSHQYRGDDVLALHHSLIGASATDCLLLALVTLLSVSNYSSRTRLLAQLRSALHECERTKSKLRQATRTKAEFLANMNHELRTPMHGIISMSSELHDLLLPGTKASKAVTIISDCADHLLSLVNDILDFEHIEANCLKLESVPFSLVREIYKVIDMLRFSAEKKHLNLSVKILVSHTQRLGDPVRFRQILFNLVSNAIKFTPEKGSVGLMLNSPDTDRPEDVELTVTDTGIGIPDCHMPRIFSSFTQVDASVSRSYGGSGLGLAICKRLCDAMGGVLECTSELGKGTTFRLRLTLPEFRNAGGDLLQTSEDTVRTTLDEGTMKDTSRPPRFDGLDVLLAEDNVVNQKVGKRMLHSLGCNVTIAKNGQECVQLAEQQDFDVVLMDCQMPVMDGFRATQKIRELERQDPARPVLPVIALTASSTTEYRLKCMEVGMSDVLFKPLRREVLGAALAKWAPHRLTATSPSASKRAASSTSSSSPSTTKSSAAAIRSPPSSSPPSPSSRSHGGLTSSSPFPVLYREPEALSSSAPSSVKVESRRSRSMPSGKAPNGRGPTADAFLESLREEVEAAHRKLKLFSRKEST